MKKRFLLSIAAMLLMMPQVLKADGFPRYYELVQETEDLESGKYYIIAAVPDNLESLTNRIAYNGINTNNHYGNADRVSVPATYIIDIGSTEKHAVPLKFIQNGEKWNLYDETATKGSQLIGVNSDTESSSGSQHYLVTGNDNDDDLFLWYITVSSGIATIQIQKTINNIYYMRYDSNNYNDPTSFFRVYSLTDNKLRVMLYKEMETITAETYYTGHGTLYYRDKVLMVPEGVTAKTYIFDSETKRVKSHDGYNYTTGNFIPANSAVILHNTSGTIHDVDTYTFPVTNRHNPDRDDKNILRGLDDGGTTTTGDETEDENYYFYKLTTKNGANVGFYWGDSKGGRFISAAHKAYLAIEKKVAANIRSFLLDFSETTSINNVSLPTQENTMEWVYDLSGRRFSTSQSLPKGIYISNGKKFVVK